jgi:ribosome recycling factor
MPDMVILETEEAMESRLQSLSKELSKVRTGRANPRMLDDVKVDYYGALTPLSQIGSISVPEPSQLVIKPYDNSMLGTIEKAINAANLGINPANEGAQLRIVLPALTTETRKSIVKTIHKLGEEYKVFIRNSRREGNDAIKKLEKNSEISEDDSKGYQEDIQELTNNYTKQIDDLIKAKEIDIMHI